MFRARKHALQATRVVTGFVPALSWRCSDSLAVLCCTCSRLRQASSWTGLNYEQAWNESIKNPEVWDVGVCCVDIMRTVLST